MCLRMFFYWRVFILKNPFKDLNKFEFFLWLSSVCIIIVSAIIFNEADVLNVISSLIGVTALIFLAKGYVIGQILIILFSVFYGVVSFYFAYYGEMITYLGMTTPMAVITAIEWLKHPYKGSKEVEIRKLTVKNICVMFALTAIVTVAFYFILKFLSTANLIFSTISVATSFFAAYLTFLRSPYYALGYAANDVVLIVPWILATIDNFSYFPMIICFILFLINDLYGFFNWKRMQNRQKTTFSN